MPRRLHMPSEDELPPGPRRAFVDEVHMLWRAARRPDLRTVAARAADPEKEYPGSMSSEGVRRMLHGTGVPAKWGNVETVFLVLCELAEIEPEQDRWPGREAGSDFVSYRDEFLQRWHDAYDAITPTPRPAAVTPAPASSSLTDRYVKAIEQLGNESSVAVRLGGIYALQQLAVDSPDDGNQTAVVEVLSAFVRLNLRAGLPDPSTRGGDGFATLAAGQDSEEPSQVQAGPMEPRADVLAAISVLAQLPRRAGVPMRADFTGLSFAGVDLSRARLAGADLEGVFLAHAGLTRADLTGANLTGTRLGFAELRGAVLARANLTRADLHGATLTEAILAQATLCGADLTRADLDKAWLTDADLTGADLSRTDFTDARGLTEEQLKTTLPLRDGSMRTLDEPRQRSWFWRPRSPLDRT